jgi:folate-dependent phosphoribosylglycinamide formyltransferase PurN
MPLRLAFMGTPDFAVPALRALVGAGHDVAAVYCQPPRPAGRGHKERPSAVQAAAEALGLPVRTPVSLRKEEEQEAFAALGLDIAVVAAYGLILPKPILTAPKHGCLNIHASLLPRWRGAAPIQRAILAGDSETGITIMQMDEGLDTGDMLLQERIPITGGTTAETLHDALADCGGRLILQALEQVEAGTLAPEPQPEPTQRKSIPQTPGSTGKRPRPKSTAPSAPSRHAPAPGSKRKASASSCSPPTSSMAPAIRVWFWTTASPSPAVPARYARHGCSAKASAPWTRRRFSVVRPLPRALVCHDPLEANGRI